ncbi:MAG: FAD-binding protein [Treponema sp.]|jgi:electron transfer flavoprotein alpha subunit|nr:FAD-binding protein [Treponema sp.]
MTTAFILSGETDPAAPRLWEFIAPIHTTSNHVESWYSGIWDIRSVEGCLRWLEKLCAARQPDLILLPETSANHELGTRLSARINRTCYADTTMLLREGKNLYARKKACSSNLTWDSPIVEYPVVLTVSAKKTTYTPKESDYSHTETRPPPPLTLPHWLLSHEQIEVFPTNPLETAPLLFIAGRGVGSKGACERLRRVAGRFGAPLGFSRPAALNGWGEISEIIGQSGIRTGAKRCVAVGISGAAAFMAGIDPAATLIAVNPDKNAPIFHYADIGITTHAEEFIAALEKET